MITLTSPAVINAVLGGSLPVSYDKLVLSSLTHNPVNMTVTGSVLLTATAAPDMQPLTGNLSIWAQLSQGGLEISVTQIDFYRKVKLSSAQAQAVMGMITNAQTAIEAGLISLGIIIGTQTTGA